MALRVFIIKETLSARTGATKLTLEIAKAFAEEGDDVHLVFFHDDGSSELIRDSIAGLKFDLVERSLPSRISKLIQSPVMKLFMRDAFSLDDAVNLLGELFFTRKLNSLGDGIDLIIFMNMWSGIPAVFMSSRYRSRSVLYFHESPSFSGLPLPVRLLLRLYLRLLLSRVCANVSITEATRRTMEAETGIRSSVVPDAFRPLPYSSSKGDYVLVDTRWTFVRNPFFLIDIALQSEGIRFMMCGSFGSRELRERFIAELGRRGLSDRVELHFNSSEEELQRYYSDARCYLRWSNSTISETGPSFGVIQAVSNGCIPVVSSNLGASEYVAEHLGSEFVVENDPRLFSVIVKKLFTDDEFYSRTLERLVSWRDSYGWKDYRRELLRVAEEARMVKGRD